MTTSADLTISSDTTPAVEWLTIKVHNFKDDPTGEMISLHGLFTDPAEAARVAKALIPDDYNGFLTATVTPLLVGAIEKVAEAQHIGWVPETQTRIEQDADAFLSLTTGPDDHLVEGLPTDSSYNDAYEGEDRR